MLTYIEITISLEILKCICIEITVYTNVLETPILTDSDSEKRILMSIHINKFVSIGKK
jgi:hypothetical protein